MATRSLGLLRRALSAKGGAAAAAGGPATRLFGLGPSPAEPRVSLLSLLAEPWWLRRGAGALPAEEVQPGTYSLQVFTGDVRGAGTQVPASFRLVGALGESEEYLAGCDAENPGFGRGQHCRFDITVDRDLGPLRHVVVQQLDSSATELGTGWYLDRVEVQDPQGERVNYPCHAWLGKSDANAAAEVHMERNLIPCEQHPSGLELGPLDRPLSAWASSFAVAHPEKVGKGLPKSHISKSLGWAGEDAYFVADRPGFLAVGIADGVYSWREQGVDAGEISRELMARAKASVEAGASDVLAVLRQAERGVLGAGLKGSTTACLVFLDLISGRLASATLGDSGFAVVSPTQAGASHPEGGSRWGGTSPQGLYCRFRSPQQEHHFGCPYQLGHHQEADTADDAMLMTLPVREGDILVVGSDGLWDNVAEEQLVSILLEVQQEGQQAGSPPEGLPPREGAPQGGLNVVRAVRRLTEVAFENSRERGLTTPYSLGACEAFDMVYTGGKQDDITISVVAL